MTITREKSVVVYNSGFQALGTVPIRRAITLIYLGRAVAIDTHPQETFGDYALPLSISILRYIYPEWVFLPRRKMVISRVGVLRRDNYKCGYCGRAANTIDHVLPRQAGGKTTWKNCVAACGPCNFRKRNRTPAQAGMTLWTVPTLPTY